MTFVWNSFRDAIAAHLMGLKIVADVETVRADSGIVTDSKTWGFFQNLDDRVQYDEVTMQTRPVRAHA